MPGIFGVFFGCGFFKSSALGIPGVEVVPFGTLLAVAVFGSGIPGVAAVEFVGTALPENSGGKFAEFPVTIVFVTLVVLVLVGAVAVVQAKEIAAIEITEIKLKLRNIINS